MRRTPVVALLLALPMAGAAPVPKHLTQGPVYYYPTTAAAMWVYRGSGDDFTLVASKVEDRDGAKVVSVELVYGDKRRPYQSVEVSPAGLTRTGASGGYGDEPDLVLRAPFSAGSSWPFDLPGGSAEMPRYTGTYDIVGVERVTVLAGTFEAVRVGMS